MRPTQCSAWVIWFIHPRVHSASSHWALLVGQVLGEVHTFTADITAGSWSSFLTERVGEGLCEIKAAAFEMDFFILSQN